MINKTRKMSDSKQAFNTKSINQPCVRLRSTFFFKLWTELFSSRFLILPRVRRPTEHLTAVFDDVLVAVRVLDSVLSRPGSFNLGKTKRTQHPSLEHQTFSNHQPASKHSPAILRRRSVLFQKDLPCVYTLFKSIAPFLDVTPTGWGLTY